MRARDRFRGGSSFFLREWWLASDRLGVAPDFALASEDADTFLAEFAAFPLLCVAFLVERGEATTDKSRARALLNNAERLLERTPEKETQWHARVLEMRARLVDDIPWATRRASSRSCARPPRIHSWS
jgi:hypothetical protein